MLLGGLDNGTTAGFSVHRGDRLVHSESIHFDGETDGEVFSHARKWLMARLDHFGLDELAIEEPLRTDLAKTERTSVEGSNGLETVVTRKPIGTMRTFLRLYGLRAIALQVCDLHRRKRIEANKSPFKYREINNKTWRSKVYGKMSPPAGTNNTTEWWKEQALARCRMLGWSVTAKDEAEAVMIGEGLRIILKEERLGIVSAPGEPDLFDAF